MLPTGFGWRDRPRAILLYLPAALVFLAFVVQWYFFLKRSGGLPFMDADVYARSIATARAGGDPYLVSANDLPFLYPPVFLHVEILLSHVVPAHLGWYLYLTVDFLAMLSVPWIISTVYIRSQWLTPFVAMLAFAFQPTFIEEYAMLGGNIANLLYPFALAAGVPGLRRNKWLLFYFVVALASLVKPTFLALLLLPLFAGRHQLRNGALCTAVVAVGYLLQRIFLAHEYAEFQRNVYTEVFVRGDDGWNILNYISRQSSWLPFLHNPLFPLAAHCLVVGAILGCLVLLRRRTSHPLMSTLWIPALLVVTILVNPRMQHIDAEVAVVPALYLCIECARTIRTRLNSLGILAVAFTLFESLVVKQIEMGMLFLLYSSVFLSVFLLFRNEVAQVDTLSA